jgi:hypothetical protein
VTKFIKGVLILSSLAACLTYGLRGERLAGGSADAQEISPLSRWQSREYTGIGYVGSKVCAQCHTAEAEAQPATPMAHALEPATGCAVLARRRQLTFTNAPYVYRLTGEGGRPTYSVTDGKSTISEPILYCFGQGVVGQTYVFRHDGQLYETRVSYYRGIDGLDFTVGHSHSVPTSLGEALGRPIGSDEARNCFGCHAPESVEGDRLRAGGFSPGVTCEGCHGPGARHVAAAGKGLKDLQIFNPAGLNALELSQEFCGSCHLSFDRAMQMPEQGGQNNIRFQAYRIFNSHGHGGGDPRVSCVACHDPHHNLERSAAYYDSKCLACHLSTAKELKTDARSAPACPVSTKQCVSCHMPKVAIPETHAEFTDHWIRVVRPGEAIPR